METGQLLKFNRPVPSKESERGGMGMSMRNVVYASQRHPQTFNSLAMLPRM